MENLHFWTKSVQTGVEQFQIWRHETFAMGHFWPKHLTLGQKGCIEDKKGNNFMINLLEDLQKFPALGLSSWAAMFAHSYKKPSALSG